MLMNSFNKSEVRQWGSGYHFGLPIQGSQDQFPASPVFWMRLQTKVPYPYDPVVVGTLNLVSFTQSIKADQLYNNMTHQKHDPAKLQTDKPQDHSAYGSRESIHPQHSRQVTLRGMVQYGQISNFCVIDMFKTLSLVVSLA